MQGVAARRPARRKIDSHFILLGLLRQPASGYDLKAILDQGIGHFWAAELSRIYPTLKRLEEKRWLRSRQAPARWGPGRRVYEITPVGRRALREWLASGPQVGDERFAHLARLTGWMNWAT